jgi:hypothetical protein
MTSIYQRAMGSDFNKLHPKIQERFGFSSTDGKACVGRGIMEEVWHGAPYTIPFLHIGTMRNIMFPEKGKNVPFTIENYAFVDDLGRETVTWIRRFQASSMRRFDAYMIFSEKRGKVVDYLGSHEHLAVDIDLSVADNGGLKLRSGAQRFYEGGVGFDFPMAFSGVAEVCEWFDEAENNYKIKVEVANSVWGKLFGYHGKFQAQWKDASEVPPDLLPKRVEKRE